MSLVADKINELNAAEEPATELLRQLGYTFIPRRILAAERDHERDVLLRGRLKAALLRLNPWLNADEAERALFKLERVDEVGIRRNQVIHEYLTYGLPLEVETGSGRQTRIVRFFDFDYPQPRHGRNEFVVTTQMRVRRRRDERATDDNPDDDKYVIPDLVLFVNGIPLVVIEAKAPTLFGDLWRARAVERLRRYQEAEPRWHGRGAPELFDWNLLCAGICGKQAVYGPIGAQDNEYAEWKAYDPLPPAARAEAEAREQYGTLADGQGQLLIGLLAPARLLDVLRDYVAFELGHGRLVKKLPRYQQYRAVSRAMARILSEQAPTRRGGVIWHTQGSGKSLTMLWLATKLRREPRLGNPTIVVVTDRTQLDEQITGTFQRCGFPVPEATPTTKALREKLASQSGRTVLTTIQKFQGVLDTREGRLPVINADPNLFVLVDEAHRTQYGKLHAKMRAALPMAVLLGFTGTPLDKPWKSTVKEFGELIDQYTIPESVADGATVPIYYEARLPELSIVGPEKLDQLFDAVFAKESEEQRARIRRRYATKAALAEAERRIEQIAKDIADHFRSQIQPNGFKAQVVAPSRLAALAYCKYLGQFGIEEAYPIITTTNDDDARFDEARALPQRKIIEAFKDRGGAPQVLVVVDMLLTGFDAPVEQVLYLDRELHDHALLQAIARVNRPCTVAKDGVTAEKRYGLVVDYWGVSRELQEALATFDEDDYRDVWRELEGDPSEVIGGVAARAQSYFKGCRLDDPWDCIRVFAADRRPSTGDDRVAYKEDEFARFEADYRELARLVDQYLPNPAALAYVDLLSKLTEIRGAARATYQQQEGLDWSRIGAKVKELIDSRIDADVRHLMTPVSVLDQDFEQKIKELPHEEARASVMEHALRAQIKERLDENPEFYRKLSEQLDAIIDEMRKRVIDAATAVRHLRALLLQMLSVAAVAKQHGLGEVAFAVYQLEQVGLFGEAGSLNGAVREESVSYDAGLDERLKANATRIEQIVVAAQGIVDWQQNEDVLRELRRDVKRELRALGGLSEEQLNELTTQVVDIARRRPAR
jgi:type I restriction enzyme R subunit